MNPIKVIKDWINRRLWELAYNRSVVPAEVVEFSDYFRFNRDGINFNIKREGNVWVAESTNFRQGIIITSAPSKSGLDSNIKDAIRTAFSIPSVYADMAKVNNMGERKIGEQVYA